MAENNNLNIKITADSNEAVKSLNKLEKALFGTSGKISLSALKMNLLQGAVAGLTSAITNKLSSALIDLAKSLINIGVETIKEADNFKKMGERMALTAEDVAGFSRAISLAGGSTESFDMAMTNLARALDPTQVTEVRTALEKLGVSVKDSSGHLIDQRELLYRVSDAYKSEENAATKAALGQAAFGRSAREMTVFLNQGSDAIRERVSNLGKASGYNKEYTEAAEKLNDALDKGKMIAMGFFAQFTNFAPIRGSISLIDSLSNSVINFMAKLNGKQVSDFSKKTEEYFDIVLGKGGKLAKLDKDRVNANKKNEAMRKARFAAMEQGVAELTIQQKSLESLEKVYSKYQEQLDKNKKDEKYEENTYALALRYDEMREQINERIEESQRRQKESKNALAPEENTKTTTTETKKLKVETPKEIGYDYDSFWKEIETQEKALDDMRAIRERNRIDSLGGYKQEVAEINYKFEIEREKILELAEISGAAEEERIAVLSELEDLRLAKIWSVDKEIAEEKRKNHEKELAYLDEQYRIAKENAEKEREYTMQMVSDQTNAYASIAKAMATYGKAGGKTMQGIAISEALINTALSATKTASSYPFPLNIPMIAGAVAQGMLQVASIKSQKFEKGGIVGGTSYSGDNVPVMVNSGELILNRAQQAEVWKMVNGRTNLNGQTIIQFSPNISNGINAEQTRKMLKENMNLFQSFIMNTVQNKRTAGVFV